MQQINSFQSFKNLSNFDNHKFVNYIYDYKTGLEGFITIHSGNDKMPSFGATRLWNYKSAKETLLDSLSLSKTMSYKAALAGLPCGGAKATLILNDAFLKNRKEVLIAYAKYVNYLSGHFVTGADVGISQNDVILMKRFSPYFVGNKVDPVRFTADGLLLGIQACLKEVYGTEETTGRTFAIQGVGKVGSELIKLLYKDAEKIYITDINNEAVSNAIKKYPKIIPKKVDEITSQDVDVFSPCALGGTFTKDVVSTLRCKIIVGSANSQLSSEEIGKKIHDRNILYGPDYVVNAGGIIGVYDEYENNGTNVKRVEDKVKRIKKTMTDIINTSKKTNRSTHEVAQEMGKEIISKL